MIRCVGKLIIGIGLKDTVVELLLLLLVVDGLRWDGRRLFQIDYGSYFGGVILGMGIGAVFGGGCINEVLCELFLNGW